MNGLLDFIEQNKTVSIYVSLFLLILWGILYFAFPIEDKSHVQTSTVIENIEPKHTEIKESKNFQKFSQVQKAQVIKKKVNQGLSVLSSANVGIYTIALIGAYKTEDINHTDSLNCVLKLRKDKLQFELPIDKEMLKNIDEVFIRVTTNETHIVIEDAYILKTLKEDLNYFLTLLLYEDYVSLSLSELGKKHKQALIMNNNVNIKSSQFKFSEIQNMPSDLMKEKLVKSEQMKLLR